MGLPLWHFVALLPLAAVLLLAAPSDGFGQPPAGPHAITVCVHGHEDSSGYFSDSSVTDVGIAQDNSGPPVVGVPNWAVHTRRIMSTFVECSLDFADNDIVPRVLPWFNGILVIMFVWTGVTVMFSGSVSVQTLLPFLMMAAFASGLRNVYYSPTAVLNIVGVNQGLSHTVLLGAEVISETLFEQADEVYYTTFDAAREAVEDRSAQLIHGSGTSTAGIIFRIASTTAGAAAAGTALGGPVGTGVGAGLGLAGSIWDELTDYADAFMQVLWNMIVMGTMWSFLGILHIAYWIIMAQYMWGYFSMAVIAVVGPFFIPLLLVPQTQDYFWGWFKALVNSGFYMITSAALYVIVAVVLTIPLQYLISDAAMPPTDHRTAFAGIMEYVGNLFMQYLPVMAMALLAALQVGGIANGMTAGSQPPGAGLAGRVRQLGAGGAAVSGARNYARDKYNQFQEYRSGVLSGDTRQRRQAVAQAHQAFGDGPTSQTGSGPTVNVKPPPSGGASGPAPGGGGGGGGPVPVASTGGPGSGPGPGPRSSSSGGGPVPSVLRSPEFLLLERRMGQARQPAQMAKALAEYKRAILRSRQ